MQRCYIELLIFDHVRDRIRSLPMIRNFMIIIRLREVSRARVVFSFNHVLLQGVLRGTNVVS